MIDTINMLVSFCLECFIFIFYTNLTMTPRKNIIASNAVIIAGYILLYGISWLNIPLMNAVSFVIINFAAMYLGFKTNIKNAVIQSLILTAIMMISEGILSMFTDVSSEANCFDGKSFSVKMLHGVLSKMIYFIGIVIVKFLSKDKSEYKNATGFLSLIVIPAFTIMSIAATMSVFRYISEQQRLMFAFLSVFGIAANIIVYWMYDKTLLYHKEIQELQKQSFENNLELNYCNMLEDKLRQTKVMRHDFKEHLNILASYINSDNNRAMEYLKSIEIKNEEINIFNYTNNRVLNVLLSEKQKSCINEDISLKIHASEINLDFMKDIDIVSVFSNLLNNAIEGAKGSEKKIIYVNLYKMNNAFLVIKVENSCDKEPVEENGFFKTTKTRGEHGIGLKSVSRALREYGGDLRITYDSPERIFSVTIMIPLK